MENSGSKSAPDTAFFTGSCRGCALPVAPGVPAAMVAPVTVVASTEFTPASSSPAAFAAVLFGAAFLFLVEFFPIVSGTTINAPTNTSTKSTMQIPVVIKKSKNSRMNARIPNMIQNVFLLFSLEIIFESGKSTNTDICIDTNASMNNATKMPIPLPFILCSPLKNIDKNILPHCA